MSSQRPRHPCLVCGELTTNRLVCSRQCTGKLKTQRALVPCAVCQQLFKPQRHHSKQYCSRQCAGLARQNRTTVSCRMCGKPIVSKASHPRTFCSKQCHDAWLPSQRPVHTCRHCQKPFTTTRGHQRKPLYCSKDCRDAHRKSQALKFTCLQCHKPFINSAGNPHPRFCSRACLNLYKGPSSIETTVASLLTDLSVGFSPQVQLGEYVFDFFVPASGLFIECDGTFWHSSREAQNRDRYKDRLATQNGFRVLRLSQEMITHQLEQCRALIVEGLLHAPSSDRS